MIFVTGANGLLGSHICKTLIDEGYKVKVIDTVGAGDSFLGSLITKLLNNTPPQDAIDYACAVGALVASHEGANPQLDESDILAFINA